MQLLGTFIHQRAYDEIVYVDETTFNLWQKTSKSWLTPGMKLHMLKNRGPSITVIGAISKERGLVHLDVFQENNNAIHFQRSLQRLKAKCVGRRVVVVLDNLRIHHAKLLHDMYDENFKELFLPPYSSTLNPIEVFWSLVKRRWSKNLYHLTEVLAHLPASKNVTTKTIE